MSLLPSTHRAGTSIDWAFSLGDYSPAGGWACEVILTPESGVAITLTADPDAQNAGWEVNEIASVSDAWTPGRYSLSVVVSKADDVHVLHTQPLCVQLKVGTASTELAAWQSQLTVIDEAIAAVLADKGIKEYKIQTVAGDRELSYMTLKELREHRVWLLNQIDRIKVALGLSGRSKAGWRPVRFSLP